VVAVQLPNWWEFVALYVAVTRADMVLCPVSPAYRRSELRHILNTSGAVLLVVPAGYKGFDYVGLAREVAPDVPGLLDCYVVGEAAGDGIRPFSDLLGTPRETPVKPVDANSPTFVLFTSGSEAAPKAVVHTHATANYSIVSCSGFLGLSQSDVVLVAAPVTHAAGFNWCLRIALYLGATQVLVDTWAPAEAARIIDETSCTFTYAPTRFLQDLLELAASGTSVRLRTFGSGGSPIPRQFVQQAKELMGCQVLATYGQTECFAATSTRLGDSDEQVASTDGCAIPGAAVRIVDDQGDDVTPGQQGLCITRGPHVAAGYLQDDGIVRHFSEDGWLSTGDICTMDEAGYIRVVGRQKEVIIRNGMNISPAEIESHLLKIPGVRQAGAVGYSDALTGEKVCAAVVIESGHTLTLESVTTTLTEVGVARYKHPEKLIVVDEIPHSAIGKMQRRELKRQLVETGQLPADPGIANNSEGSTRGQ
jgi:acyl-CoA synthetase (AMP-forming)/AMP-acid ligase II